MPFSMTGFVRQQQQLNDVKLTIEIRSVNSRYLDVSMHLSDSLRSMEFDLKKIVSGYLSRGKVGVSIQLSSVDAQAEQIDYNKDYAKLVAKTLHDIDKVIYNAAPVRAIDILNWPGVLNSGDNLTEETQAELINCFKQSLEDLQSARKREGDSLAVLLLQRCEQILGIVKQIQGELGGLIQQYKDKLEAKLKNYQQQLDENRLEQEIVLFVQKMDIAEELDRIVTHIAEVKRIIGLNPDSNPGAQGRRLDFLMQELNREANTIGSKSVSATTSTASVDLKVLIEQMREQVQNIE